MNKKPNLLTIATALVIAGFGGGIIGNVSAGVVYFDATAKSLAQLQAVARDPGSTKSDLIPLIEQSVATFQAAGDAAKAAWNAAKK